MKIVETVLVFLVLIKANLTVFAQTLAFPTAVGFGGYATGGRGGSVYHVTNLNDSGLGSFRDAVSVSNRIVVFDIGGYIKLKSVVYVKSNITIAGQTAPGGGIAVMGSVVSLANASNVIVRYMRFRPGDASVDPWKYDCGLDMPSAKNIILDHVSAELSQFDQIAAIRDTNITVQNSIIANPVGYDIGSLTSGDKFTWYRNLFANIITRCPMAKENSQYINNVVYNYGGGFTTGDTNKAYSHDIINNYFISGPSTSDYQAALYQVNRQKMYRKGNYLDGNLDGILNGTSMPDQSSLTPMGDTITVLSSPWSSTTNSIPTLDATSAYTYVIANAGASLKRDSFDLLVVKDVSSLGKSGHYWKSQTESKLGNGGFGTLLAGNALTDTDQDGMPDAWETAHGTNPSVADNNGYNLDKNYTNIEVYINCLVGEGNCSTPTCTAIISSTSTSFCAGSSVLLKANAGSSYQWFNGTTEVGTASTYTATSGGSYTVIVTNASGCKDTSVATIISVMPLPTVSISSPINNATVTSDSVTIKTSTSSNVTSVTFYEDSTYLGMDATSPFSYKVSNLANGSYSFSAVAQAGNCTNTAAVNVKVAKVITALFEVNVPEEGFSCYPNPFQNGFTVKAIGSFVYFVSDMTGNVIESGNGKNATPVGADLKSGVYLVKIQNQSSSKTIKVTKN